MKETPFKKFSKPEYGFTVSVPEGWSEFPALLSNSAYEVARFAYRDHTNHACIVFRMPGSPGLDPRGTAEQALARQRSKGYGNCVLADARLGDRAGLVLTFDKTTESGPWAAREYFVSAGSLIYCLGLGSGDPKHDADVFDAIAARFSITET